MITLEEFIENSIYEIPNGFCMLKPGFCSHADEFEKILNNSGWKILNRKLRKFSYEEAQNFYKMHKEKDFYNELCKYISSGKCYCISCYKICDDPIKEMNILKEQVRKRWGKDKMHNAMHSSDNIDNVKREYSIAFK